MNNIPTTPPIPDLPQSPILYGGRIILSVSAVLMDITRAEYDLMVKLWGANTSMPLIASQESGMVIPVAIMSDLVNQYGTFESEDFSNLREALFEARQRGVDYAVTRVK